MNPNARDEAELRRTIYDLADGVRRDELSPEQLAALERLVIENVDARRLYLRCMQELHSLEEFARERVEREQLNGTRSLEATLDMRLLTELIETGATTRPDENAELELASRTAQGGLATEAERVSPWQSVVRFANLPLVFSLLFAGVCCVSLMLTLAQFRHPQGDLLQPAAPQAAVSQVIVARLSGGENLRWRSSSPMSMGKTFAAGERLQLRRGSAELEFHSRAKVVLQAPVTLHVLENAIELQSGRVTAWVPEEAHGFTVTTPAVRVVDLGTEFGVETHGVGGSEVYVYEGQVELFAPTGASLGKLSAGDTVRVEPSAAARNVAQVRAIAPLSDKFTRLRPTLDEARRQTAPEPAEKELPQTALVLWLDAAQGVQRDDAGRVSTWTDLAAADQQRELIAHQIEATRRPHWVADAVGGRPAIRFDGQNDFLVTGSFTTSDDLTLVALLAPHPAEEDGQIFNGNGPPHVVLSADARGAMSAWSFDGELRNVTHTLRTGPLPLGKPQLTTLLYGYSTGEAQMFLDLDSQGTTPATTPVSLHAQRYLGCHSSRRHFFCGDLAELLIYNRLLTTSERRSVAEYFHRKYQLGGLSAATQPNPE